MKKLETGKSFLWSTKSNGGQQVVDVEWDKSNSKEENQKELEE
jgi:hypothetical protein